MALFNFYLASWNNPSLPDRINTGVTQLGGGGLYHERMTRRDTKKLGIKEKRKEIWEYKENECVKAGRGNGKRQVLPSILLHTLPAE